MVNATNQPTSQSIMPEVLASNPVNPEPVTAFYVKDGAQTNTPSLATKPHKSKLPIIGGLMLMLLLIVGLATGLYFMNEQQDSRQQADDTGTANCQVCDLNNDGNVSANEVSQLSQCIGAQIGQGDGGFCFINGQVRDPNGDGVLNSADTQACTECIGTVAQTNNQTPTLTPIPTPIPERTNLAQVPGSAEEETGQTEGDNPLCTTALVTNASAEWQSNYTKIKLTWSTTGGQFNDYEIWNIGYGTPEQLGQSGYYLSKLTTSPLPGSTSQFIVDNPNSLPTRRFLIRGVKSRNSAGAPTCYKQSATCQPPFADSRQVVKIDDITYRITWQPIQKPHQKYEIWLIGNGTLAELGAERFYLAKLLDNIDVNANSAQVVVPVQYRTTPPRFLLRSVNYSDSGGTNPLCYNEWALATIATSTPTPTSRPNSTPTPIATIAPAGNCTISFNVSSNATPTPTNTVTPTNTPNPTATPVPSIDCNQVCTTNADCTNSGHICFTDSSGVNRCRLETNPTNVNCQPATTQQPVTLPQELPQSGPAEWLTWMKAGLAVLGIGAALLLML